MNRLRVALLAAVVLAAAAVRAHATTYYVDQNHPSASDNNPGTEALPLRTIDNAANRAYAGDTIIVKAGIYREAVTPSRSGTAAQPITLKGAPGERVIVTGADTVGGWTVCDETTAKGNPHYANIYRADINWRPGSLYQDEQPLEKGRTPNIGWWVCDGGTTLTVVDTAHLTQADDYWNGAEIFLWDTSITGQYLRTVTDFDSATSTLTVDSVWYSTNVPEANADRYYLQNKVELIDEEGEWAVEDMGGGTYRVYLWPFGSGNPADSMIEGSRRSRFVVEWGNMGYWVYDNLEIRHGAGHGIGCWSSGNPGHITVQNCSIHHNDGTGIYGRYNEGGLYRRDFVCFNDGGISVSDRGGVTIEECEVGHNWYDGIVLNGDDCTVRRSWIHGHWWWSHADNLQTWGDQSNLTIEDNLIVNAGQSYMMAQCDHVYYTGNTIIGARAYMVILGHDSCSDFWFDHNTMMFSHYGLINTSGGTNVNIANGLNVKGHHGSCWGANEAMGYTSDYNLFWHADGMSDTPVIWEGNYSMTLSEYATASGRDTHSVYATPQFTSAPHSYYAVSSMSGETFYTDRVYVSDSSDMSLIKVGDHIELDFDGVVRTVTNVIGDRVEFTPAERRVAFKTGAMVNWKDKTDFTWDLTLKPGSPAIGLAQDGSNVGSSINVAQYMARDFDGDWVRDIPIWPYEPPPVCEVRKWEVLAAHGAADIGHEFTDTTVYGGTPGVTRLRLTFGAPVDPATVDLSSVTIVGAASGDRSSTIAAVTLADINKAMTVELSEPLPDADRYTITVADTVKAGDGTDVQGTRSAVLAVLAGDVNDSGSVGPADIMEVRNRAGRDVSETTATWDVDGNGVITTADMRAIRTRSGNVLP